MRILCIVPCGKRKVWDDRPETGPTKAEKVYTGSFAKKCQEYARKFYPGSYVILSAKYGFLWPDELIPGSYNVTFNKKSTNPITIPELIHNAKAKGLFTFDEIVVVAGSNYSVMAHQVFPGKPVRNALIGCSGNGIMMAKMTDAIRRNNPL